MGSQSHWMTTKNAGLERDCYTRFQNDKVDTNWTSFKKFAKIS